MAYFNKVKCLFSIVVLILSASHIIASQELHPAERSKMARSIAGGMETSIDFYNESERTIKLFWLDQNGNRVYVVSLKPSEYTKATTYLSQPWLATDERDNALSLYYPDAQPRTIEIRSAGAADRNTRNDQNNRTDARQRPYEDDDYDDPKAVYDTKPVIICRDQPIPRGFIVIKAGNDFNCPNWNAIGSNTYTIQRPSRTEATNICQNQEIPRGFVITGASNDWGCPNWNATGTNRYTIRRPRETENICSISEIPRGFVMVSGYADWNCPNWTATGANAKRIQRVK